MIRAWLIDYLVNSAWQVPLICAAAWLCSRIARALGSRVLHRIWVVALLFEVALPACRLDTSTIAHQALLLLGSFFHPEHGVVGHIGVTYGPSAIAQLGFALPQWLQGVLLAGYAATTCYFALRLLWNLDKTRRLARTAQAIGGTNPNLAVSPQVRGPVTVGSFKGLVILPAGFLERAAEREVQAVLAHETAHIHRHDYLKNLLYQVISLPIAWHPATRVTRMKITETREMICDEKAASALGDDGDGYARSLLRLASLCFEAPQSHNFHAIGILDANIFERRVMNLLQPRPVARTARITASLACCALVAIATSASAFALRIDLRSPLPVRAGQDGREIKVGAGVMAAQAETKKMPIYPAEAKAKKDTLDGPVVLDAIIGKDGKVQNLKVIKSLRADYDASALEAVKDWTYKPYLLNGEPTAVETTITVTYSIDHNSK